MFLWTQCLRRPDEGAMFFLKREHTNGVNLKDSLTHHSYGKWSAFLINMHCQNTFTFLSGLFVYLFFFCKCRGAMNFWYISILKMFYLLTRCECITLNLCLFIRQARICNKFLTLVSSLLNLITFFVSFLLSSSPGQWSRMCYIPQIGVEQNTGEWGGIYKDIKDIKF